MSVTRIKCHEIHTVVGYCPDTLETRKNGAFARAEKYGTKNGKGYDMSRLQKLAAGSCFTCRDIILINTNQKCPTCHEHTLNKQYVVKVNVRGELVGDGVDHLNSQDRAWAENEARLMLEVAEQEPLFKEAYLVS